MNLVFKEADVNSSGLISRAFLHENLELQEEEVFEIFGGKKTENRRLAKKAQNQ